MKISGNKDRNSISNVMFIEWENQTNTVNIFVIDYFQKSYKKTQFSFQINSNGNTRYRS